MWRLPHGMVLPNPSVSCSLPFVTTYQMDGWTALGDPSRRRVFERLTEQPQSVAELARELPISRPAVSQHLKVLYAADLVDVRAEGTRRIYQVKPDGLQQLRADLDRFWSSTLANFKRLADAEAASEQQKRK